MNLIKRVNSFALLAFITASCTTFNSQPQIQLPPGLHLQFDSCYPADGALLIRVFEKNALKASGELEWLAKKSGAWQIDLTTPMGQTMVSLTRSANKITKGGKFKNQMPSIVVDDQGFFEVDGNLLALRPSEIPCLLKNSLPRSWIPDLYQAKSKGEGSVLSFADGVRAIEIDLKNKKEMCAVITWGHYLGLVTSEMEWCFKDKKASFEGLNETKLTWIVIDE